MNINFDLLRTFVLVAQEKSFSAAARKLRITQSAVSQQIKTLEGQLGLKLFERVGRRSELTLEGNRLFKGTVNGFSNIEEAIRRTLHPKDSSHRQKVRVRIGAPGMFPKLWLRPRLPSLIDAHPGIEIEIVQGTSTEIERLLVRGKLDLSVYFGYVSSRQLVIRQIAEEELLAVASPSYFKAYGYPTSLKELRSEHRFVGGMRHLIDPWWRAVFGPSAKPPTHISVNCGDLEELLYLVKANYGISVLPSYYVSSYVESGELVRLPLDEISSKLKPSLRKKIFLAWRKGSERKRTVMSVRDHLVSWGGVGEE